MPFPLLAVIFAGASAAMQGQGSARDAALQKAQGKAVADQAGADAESMSRDLRQLLGSSAAAMAENGGTYDGSNAKLLTQSEVLGNLDRLKVLYRGDLARRGYLAAADNTRASGYIGAGTTLLMGASRAYGGGYKVPQYGGSRAAGSSLGAPAGTDWQSRALAAGVS